MDSANARPAYEADFCARAEDYLAGVIDADSTVRRDSPDSIFELVPSQIFRLIPPLALGRTAIDDAPLSPAIERIARRRDCADFVLAGIQRILALYEANPLLNSALKAPMEHAVLNFAYWYDQPGISGMCFHTENHQILFHSCEVLAGRRYPQTVFANSGLSGDRHFEHGRNLALRWIDQRARFGFAEWLSCYFEEDLLALLNLYDFSGDELLGNRAAMTIDMILFEIAVHAHRGILGTTHGRTYAEYIKGGREDPVSAIAWLVFGQGARTTRANLALTALSTSRYRCPEAILAIAAQAPTEQLSTQRSGLSVSEAARFGLRPQSQESQTYFWACQSARHPAVRAASTAMALIAGDDWLERFIADADGRLESTRAVVESGGAPFDGDAIDTALAPADIVSFRTANYVLSCAQDFRAGRPGYQQHVWQATAGVDAVVFTNHPGADSQSSAHGDRPNFWAGNRYLPRAAQYRNVLVCIHHCLAGDPYPFSHAYFPLAYFDETTTENHWTFARKDKALFALFSQHKPVWNTPADGSPTVELRAPNHDNIWVCEMGDLDRWGTLDKFATAVFGSEIVCDGLRLRFVSPTVGEVRFGYTGPLTVAGQDVALAGYKRYDNPFCTAAAGARRFTIRCDNLRLDLDFDSPPQPPR